MFSIWNIVYSRFYKFLAIVLASPIFVVGCRACRDLGQNWLLLIWRFGGCRACRDTSPIFCHCQNQGCV